jgi:hypothetical protein
MMLVTFLSLQQYDNYHYLFTPITQILVQKEFFRTIHGMLHLVSLHDFLFHTATKIPIALY